MVKSLLLKLLVALNILAIRASRGRIGGRLGAETILLLHSLGRRSGRERVIPITCFQADGAYFLIGSNWGRPGNAGWYYNLRAHPRTTIELGGKTIPVEAREVTGEEYDRLWSYALARQPFYQQYKERTTRHIPILVLEPV